MKSQIAIFSILLIPSMGLWGQSATPVAVPSQLATAQNVFLASAAAPGFSNEKAIAGILYTTVYQSLAASGRYHLVARPADAELSMVLTARLVGQQGSVLSLDIYDVKTHALLWTIDEPVFLPQTEDMQASALLFIDDLNALANDKLPSDLPAPHGKSAKARLSNQGKN